MMPNPRYVRGRSLEYKTIAYLVRQGFRREYVYRNAASHGIYDVHAARKGEILYIQVKGGESLKLPAKEYRALCRFAEEIQWNTLKDGDYLASHLTEITQGPRIAVEVWLWKRRTKNPEIHQVGSSGIYPER